MKHRFGAGSKIETFLAMVRAQRALVQRFLQPGGLDKEDDAGVQAALVDVGLAETEEDPLFQGMQLNRQQKRLLQGPGTRQERASGSKRRGVGDRG